MNQLYLFTDVPRSHLDGRLLGHIRLLLGRRRVHPVVVVPGFDHGQMVEHLPHVLTAPGYQLLERLGLDLDLFLEAHGHHRRLDLLNTGTLEPQIEAVVGETADLLVVPVVAHRYYRNLKSKKIMTD